MHYFSNSHMGVEKLCIFSRRVSARVNTVLRLLRLSTQPTVMASPSLDQHFVPPEKVRGSQTLDREAFLRDFQLPAVRLAQASLCSTFLSRLSHARLKFASIKSVVNEPSEDGKVRGISILGTHMCVMCVCEQSELIWTG